MDKEIKISKAYECSLIEFLGSHNTYFADTFKKEVVNKIKENIRNDFPILLNTGFIYLEKEEIKVLKETLKEIINSGYDNKNIIENILKKI